MTRQTKATQRAFSEWEMIGKLKEITTLPVSARGTGLCLYISKITAETYGLIAGDRVKVSLNDHFRKKPEE